MPLRCLLVDDNDAFLETAGLLLEREGLTIVGVASNIAEALRQARALRPDVILVDIGLGTESGFTLARLLARDDQSTDVILVSAGAEADYADLIAESSAAGFLAKPELSAWRIGQILGHAILMRVAPGPQPSIQRRCTLQLACGAARRWRRSGQSGHAEPLMMSTKSARVKPGMK